MLARLRHHALVGGDDEQREVHTGGAGEHVAHESLVAGHVHDAQREIADHERREAQLDRDPAALLLGEAVGVDAGERLHERGLAVIDVAGGAEDHSASQ